MKHIFFLITLFATMATYAQTSTGVGNKNPQKILDVTGTVRIRDLAIGTPYPNTNNIAVAEFDGTSTILHKAAPLDVMYASNLFIKHNGTTGNSWTNIHFGGRQTRLDFVGKAVIAGVITYFTFGVFYDYGSGIVPLANTAVAFGSATITVAGVNSTRFRVTINGTMFNFDISGGGGFGNIAAAQFPSGSGTITGSFSAISQI